ncbi:MAG TPA: hypothetical protein VFQ72_02985 [Candidatus Paceibacterota bacterium]|nr:hypothetical protein [Candidatus Paceibacterota bacterium]
MNIKPTFLIFPFLVVTVVFGTIYVVAQQSIRLAANDPQAQIAGDMALLLESGAKLSDIEAQIFALRKVDVAASLSPFVGIYDEQGRPLSTSGYLDGQQVAVPGGTLASAAKTGRAEITLQPQKGVRIAAAMRPFDQSAYGQGSGWVVSGKSLAPAEERIGKVGLLVLIGWLVSVCVFGAAAAFLAWNSKKQ